VSTPPRTAFGGLVKEAMRRRPAPARRDGLAAFACIDDLRAAARRRLPRSAWDYLEGASEDEVTARRNVEAFASTCLVPAHLNDVSTVDTATTLAGTPLSAPIVCGPTGFSRLFHTEGEVAVGAAAAERGVVYTLSTLATRSIEEVAAVGPGPRWFQLYVWRDHGLVDELLDRSRAAGYQAVCLTIDTSVVGRRERDIRRGFTIPPQAGWRTVVDGALHPRWWSQFLRSEPITFANITSRVEADAAIGAAYLSKQFDPSMTWPDAARIAERWGGPFVVKGVLSAEDATRAVDIGASVVVVSNHGGRQLDHAPATFDVLREVVDAVGHRAEVVLDSGVRRGTDIVKAVALGARACMIGRAYLYGLAVGGQAGVGRALDLLTTELRTDLALLGCPSVADLGPAHVRPREAR
jgi:L-lactate dehydrogenase (cytochrome)